MNAPALWLSFRLGARRGWAEKASIIGQCAILWALIVSYGVLFRFIPAEVLARLHLTSQQLTWYLVLTEMMVCLNAHQFLSLQDDIRNGTMEILLLRPIDFWPLQVADWLGNGLVRVAVYGLFALVLGVWLTGIWPWHGNLLFLAPITLLALLTVACAHLVIACSTVWLGECRPLYWFWQKCAFLLGALISPLAFYPHWLQTAVWFTPFPAMIAVAGNLALDESSSRHTSEIGLQIVWLIMALLVARFVANRVRLHFSRQGG